MGHNGVLLRTSNHSHGITSIFKHDIYRLSLKG